MTFIPSANQQHSLLRRAMADNHPQDATMFERFKEPPKGVDCPYCPREESHWVAHWASCLLDRSRKHRKELQFHQLFEKPSNFSESRPSGGFDLSCGPFDLDSYRIRSMHKLGNRLWCDGGWEWKPDERDREHIRLLIENPVPASVLLVLNVFYCIHDWRRMGRTVKSPTSSECPCPDFGNPLRTIIIDLGASRHHLTKDADIRVGCRGMDGVPASIEEWKSKVADGPFMYAVANEKSLKRLSFGEILDDLDRAWSEQDKWKSSQLI